MSLKIDVRSLKTLKKFRKQYKSFSNKADEALFDANLTIQQTLQRFDSRRRHWQNVKRNLEKQESEIARKMQQRAKARSSHPVVTASDQLTLKRTAKGKAEAVDALETIDHWQRKLIEPLARYKIEATRLKRMLDQDVPAAMARYKKHISDLEAYLAVKPSSNLEDYLAAMPSFSEPITVTPQLFGTRKHEEFALAAQKEFGEQAQTEVLVDITKIDGTEATGEIDLLIGSFVFDYKTDDTRDWTDGKARSHANEYGRQVQEYVDSPDTPHDARGWIIMTRPSEENDLPAAYVDTLREYGIGCWIAADETPEAVMRAAKEILESMGESF